MEIERHYEISMAIGHHQWVISPGNSKKMFNSLQNWKKLEIWEGKLDFDFNLRICYVKLQPTMHSSHEESMNMVMDPESPFPMSKGIQQHSRDI